MTSLSHHKPVIHNGLRQPDTALIHGAVIGAIGFLLFPLMTTATTDWISLCIMGGISCQLVLGTGRGAHPKNHSGWDLSLLPAHPLLLIGAIGVLGLQHILSLDKLSYVAAIFLILWCLKPYIYSKRQGMLVGLILCALMPLPAGIEASIGLWLAHLEADIFTQTAQMMGVMVFKMGTQIISENSAVTINQNCSGVLLFTPALLGMAVAFYHASKGQTEDQTEDQTAGQHPNVIKTISLVILSAFLFAFLVNMIRITILVGLHYNASTTLVDSFHDFLGWVTYPVIWGVPILYTLGLQKLSLFFTVPLRPSHGKGPIFSLIFILFATACLAQISPMSRPDNRDEAVLTIPSYSAGWIGEKTTISAEEQRILKADTVSRYRYADMQGTRQVEITFIYHKDAAVAAQHSSKKCFQALGWAMKKITPATLLNGAVITVYQANSHQNKQWVTEANLPTQALFRAANTSQPSGVWRLQIVENLPASAQSKSLQSHPYMAHEQIETAKIFTDLLIRQLQSTKKQEQSL